MDHFDRVDIYALEEELEVTRLAREEGRRDKPAKSDLVLDGPQRAIIAGVTERLNTARLEAEDGVKSVDIKLGSIDLGAIANAMSTLPVDTEMEIERTKGRFRDRLLGLRRRERGMRRELNFFQLENSLHREAHYPESEILHWAIIAALVVAESAANSYFFARGSDLGLLGGAFQALLISLVNVGAALLAGIYILRNLQHVDRNRVYVAAGGLVIYLGFMGFFNLATAHYRAQLAVDPLAALVNALLSLAKNPFGIGDFDATVLLFIGIIFSLAALTKAYMADDRYPTFGKIDRRFREAYDDYQDGKEDLREEVNGVIDHARVVLHGYTENARDASREHATLIAQSESLIGEYFRHTEELRSAINTLLNMYRTTNIKARSSPHPDYFSEYPVIKIDESLPKVELEKAKKRASQIGEDLDNIETQTTHVLHDLKDLNERALNDVEKFFVDIEEEAEQKNNDDAALGMAAPEPTG